MVHCKLTWWSMWVYQTITSSTHLNINDELLLESRLEVTVRIVISPLAVVVKMYDAASTKNLPQMTRVLT
jgi:hypothetical protein